MTTSAERKKARAEFAAVRAARADELVREQAQRELQRALDDAAAAVERDRREAERVPEVAKEASDELPRPYTLVSMRPDAVAAAEVDATSERARVKR